MNEEHEFLYDYSEFGIPKSIIISSYTSRMEKLRNSSDDLHQAMIKHILPQVIEPKIDVKKLYEPDYYLVLRHLRILTWGPFWTSRAWVCSDCVNEDGSKGKFYQDKPTQINLGDIAVLRPETNEELKTSVVVKPDDFIGLDCEVKLHLNRCQDMLFFSAKVLKGDEDFRALAASISSVSGQDFVDISEAAEWLGNLSAADEEILEEKYHDAFNVGLQKTVEFKCPVCGGKAHAYVPINDYYFRPTKENLKEWKRILADPKKKV